MNTKRIRNRFVLIGTIIVTAIIGAAGLMIETQRMASIDAFRTATVNLGGGMAQQTTQTLSAVNRVLGEIQSQLNGGDVAAVMRSGLMHAHLADRHKLLLAVDSLLLVDATGAIADKTRVWRLAERDLSRRDFFTHFATSDDHGSYVSMPVQDAATGWWTVFMARRLDDAQGKFAGLVVAEISLTDLQNFFRLAMPPNRSIYLARRDGTVLLRYPPRDGEIGRVIPKRSPWYARLASGGGAYDAQGYFDGISVIASVHPLRDLPFVVEASVAEPVALSEWYQQRWWVGLGGVSAVICALTLLRLFAVQYGRVVASEESLAAKNAELDSAHQQIDATLASLTQGVCFFDMDKKLLVFNRRYGELYDLPEGALRPGMSVREIAELRIAAGSFSVGSMEDHLVTMDDVLGRGGSDDRVSELQNGRIIAGHTAVLPGRGFVVTREDITERRQAEAKIAFMAHHDVLTGLANRAMFQERLQHAYAMAERGMGFALLCLDLDRFKAVNDTLGHPIGDRLLLAVADRLRDAVRGSDTVARLGGDEFAILQLDVSDATQVGILARRIIASINRPFELDGHLVSVGTSIGIVLAPRDGADAGQLMKDADLALYRSKLEGRGTWRFFEAAMDTIAAARRALEIDLANALALGQFELHYQPLVGSRTRILTGFEALVRWRHPERGLVPPGEFIGVAEDVGLISEIGAWVLRQACAEAALWPAHLRVAVNLSTRQFNGPALVPTVKAALQSSGLAAGRLELEITESVPLLRDQTTLLTLHELHALGTRVALDDFGTGYSSLSYLRGFAFDTIKIDRSFVSDLEEQLESVAIIRGIISLAANLHMTVTAEGVETEAQFAFLAEAGCSEIQGYLISKPVPAGDVPGLIAALSGPEPAPVLAAIAG